MDPLLLQKQVRDNAEDIQNYLKDLKIWESEMKRKEHELFIDNADSIPGPTSPASGLPPIRNKLRKTEKKAKHKENLALNEGNKSNRPRIAGYDYASWDKFDVDKACKQVDADPEESEEETETEEEDVESERLHEEANYEKERGNQFVKSQKWENAIQCYSRAIECYPYDAIFFANRALCYLKTSDLKAAETDCTSAINLDISYVKAFQRRAAARTGLGLLEEAKADLEKVIRLEPRNAASRGELAKIEKKIDAMQNETKCLIDQGKKKDITSEWKNKTDFVSASPAKGISEPHYVGVATTLSSEKSRIEPQLVGGATTSSSEKGISEPQRVGDATLSSDRGRSEPQRVGDATTSSSEKSRSEPQLVGDATTSSSDKGRSEPQHVGGATTSSSEDGCEIVYPIHKPPHLRSKKPMKEIEIKFINSGMPKRPVDLTEFKTYSNIGLIEVLPTTSKGIDLDDKIQEVPKAIKQKKSSVVMSQPKEDISDIPPPPKTYIDFYVAWKKVKQRATQRLLYLKQIPGGELSKIFQESLESTTFSELIETLETGFIPSKEPVYPYVLGMSKVKRLSTLTLFMSSADKSRMEMILDSCELTGECSKEERILLRKKFEL